jgi:hypothetical protein
MLPCHKIGTVRPCKVWQTDGKHDCVMDVYRIGFYPPIDPSAITTRLDCFEALGIKGHTLGLDHRNGYCVVR